MDAVVSILSEEYYEFSDELNEPGVSVMLLDQVWLELDDLSME